MRSRSRAPAGRSHRAPAGEGDRLRRELLDAAEARMTELGFTGMTLRQVARDVGVSATSVYLHFSSKEELAVAVCQRRFALLAVKMAEACEGLTDPLQQLRACGRAYIDFGISNPEMYLFMFGGGLTLEEMIEHIGSEEEIVGFQLLGEVADLVADAIDRGAVRPGDPSELANSIWAVVHGVVGVVAHLQPKMHGPEPEVLIENTLDLLVRGLTTTP